MNTQLRSIRRQTAPPGGADSCTITDLRPAVVTPEQPGSDASVVVFRAQDQASMQLSEMEEEMDQRIHAAERKTRDQVGGAKLRHSCLNQHHDTHSGT